MAHWAEVDENNIVLRVSVGSNDAPDEGYQWLIDNLGGTWIKTSYNTYGGVNTAGGEPLRKNYAGIGYTYDPDRDAFIPPKPFESWVLNEETCLWNSSIPKPTEDKLYDWNEDTLSWEEIVLPTGGEV
jgi:hypothetical protein